MTMASHPRTLPPRNGLGFIGERVTRRVFVAGTAGAGAAAAVRLAPAADAGPPAEASEDPRTLSYRETDHIRRFYARSRF
jgi:hypothetical protein